MNDEAQTNRIQKRNRMHMLGIMAVALVSVGGAYMLFYVAKESGGWGTTNRGAFVEPPVNTRELGWQVLPEEPGWWIWMVADQCATQCQETAANMRATHILLNREAGRVQRGYTALDANAANAWLEEYPRMVQISIADPEPLSDGVYIVDPLGNLVLYYPLDTDPEAVLQDLKKLLKLSQIG